MSLHCHVFSLYRKLFHLWISQFFWLPTNTVAFANSVFFCEILSCFYGFNGMFMIFATFFFFELLWKRSRKVEKVLHWRLLCIALRDCVTVIWQFWIFFRCCYCCCSYYCQINTLNQKYEFFMRQTGIIPYLMLCL